VRRERKRPARVRIGDMPSNRPHNVIQFGTSGFRGRWGIEFTEETAKSITQAICDYLTSTGNKNKILVIGYDSREYADRVAQWCTEVALSNKQIVHLASRDTPTPALAYYATEKLGEGQVAGIINCTSSHNPVEWQGIKFSASNACPAPPSVTDFISAQATQHQKSSFGLARADLSCARSSGLLSEFDPLEDYCQWILSSGVGNCRIRLDYDAMRRFFQDKLVIVDEMHGTGRGYLRRLLDEITVPYEVLHGERDPRLGGLVAASPEEPHIAPLKREVKDSGAIMGVGLDTDADRFGVVDQGGHFLQPNQILAMLTRYLGVDRRLNGRIAISYVSTHLVETIAGDIPNNEVYQPDPKAFPPHFDDPEYEVVLGDPSELMTRNVFTVPTGLKHIVQVPQMDRFYHVLDDPDPDWRCSLLLGGEEASGLTTKGHVPDKDGIWANLLVMEMMAHYGKPLGEIWSDLTRVYWPSHTVRLNLRMEDPAKKRLIDHYLATSANETPKNTRVADLKAIYVGGMRGKYVELRLADRSEDKHHYLHIRPSGTEPLVRVYIESTSQKQLMALQDEVRSHVLDNHTTT